VLVVAAGLCLLWYKRVMIAIPETERLLFVPGCGIGFLLAGLLIDGGSLRRRAPNSFWMPLLCGLTLFCTLLSLAGGTVHVIALALSGCCAGAFFLLLFFAGLRRLPYRRRGMAFAGCFFFAGALNTTTDIAELPLLRVVGPWANTVFACICLALALALLLWRGKAAFDVSFIPIAEHELGSLRQVLLVGFLAAVCFVLLYLSLGLRESIAYPEAVTQVAANGFIRYIELPLWIIAGVITDLVGRRPLLIASLGTAFVGAVGALGIGSTAVSALTTLATYFCIIAFPTACVALIVDASCYARHAALLESLTFAPVLVGQLMESLLRPWAEGLADDAIFLADLGILTLTAALTALLVRLVRMNLESLSATTMILQLDSAGSSGGSGGTPEENAAAKYGFTRREQQILELVMQGKTVRQMAAELFVTESTVKFHITNMLKKTSSPNRTEMLGKLGGR
jgi:DNA-binding CsgD family transcriptional regulator